MVLQSFGGLQIIVSDAALTETTERLFSFSKNRSQRIRKKLLKRFGGEFRKAPAMFRMGDRIFAHPALYHQLRARLATPKAAVWASDLTSPDPRTRGDR